MINCLSSSIGVSGGVGLRELSGHMCIVQQGSTIFKLSATSSELVTSTRLQRKLSNQHISSAIGVDLSKILGGARSGQSVMTDDIIGVSGAT